MAVSVLASVTAIVAGTPAPAGAQLSLPSLPPIPGLGDSSCPTRVDASAFTSAAELRAMNKVMADAGPRPTASPAHERFINWIDRRLQRIPGLSVRSLGQTIDRQLETGARLTINRAEGAPEAVRIAGAVPYSKPGQVTGELTHVPTGTAIAASDVAGKVVVRDAPIGTGPQAIFLAVADYIHDPDLSIDYAGNYEREFSAYAAVRTDLQEAAAAGAAGLVFVSQFPHEQAYSYQPYDGEFFGVRAHWAGVDEGEVLKRAAADGEHAKLTVRAERTPAAPTRSVVATLPGKSAEKIVIATHTDGMNAVWDNGPAAILALAEYFASLPKSCRERTIEFAFTTAHLYLSEIGSLRYAEQLSEEYDRGQVAFVAALEHLGAQEFLPVPRGSGLPGKELRPTGKSEVFVTFTNDSPVTKAAWIKSLIARDLRRTFALKGASGPKDPTRPFPPAYSYGGEGGIYHGDAILPTIAGITGPYTLFKPNFELDELVDFELMRRQTMAYGDTILKLQGVNRELIAGLDLLWRAASDATAPQPHTAFICHLPR